jgi:hypothetical protein
MGEMSGSEGGKHETDTHELEAGEEFLRVS